MQGGSGKIALFLFLTSSCSVEAGRNIYEVLRKSTVVCPGGPHVAMRTARIDDILHTRSSFSSRVARLSHL